MDHLNISFDGTRDIQNEQRPLVGGMGSFARVVNTLKALDGAGFDYSLRATVTSKSVKRMTEIVKYIMSSSKCRNIQLEPLNYCGRCVSSGWSEPAADDFVEEFKKAKRLTSEHKVRLHYSSVDPRRITAGYCGAVTDSFFVTSRGLVSSCYEVISSDDPRAPLFIYGYYDQKIQDFVFDLEKRRTLRSRTVNDMAHCRGCTYKWHCGGECPAKVADLGDVMDPRGYYRCAITRDLMKDDLLELLDTHKEAVVSGKA